MSIKANHVPSQIILHEDCSIYARAYNTEIFSTDPTDLSPMTSTGWNRRPWSGRLEALTSFWSYHSGSDDNRLSVAVSLRWSSQHQWAVSLTVVRCGRQAAMRWRNRCVLSVIDVPRLTLVLLLTPGRVLAPHVRPSLQLTRPAAAAAVVVRVTLGSRSVDPRSLSRPAVGGRARWKVRLDPSQDRSRRLAIPLLTPMVDGFRRRRCQPVDLTRSETDSQSRTAPGHVITRTCCVDTKPLDTTSNYSRGLHWDFTG